eukprot:scaffold284771_cov20-Prasinocladus_malaysianus.AAC.1
MFVKEGRELCINDINMSIKDYGGHIAFSGLSRNIVRVSFGMSLLTSRQHVACLSRGRARCSIYYDKNDCQEHGT